MEMSHNVSAFIKFFINTKKRYFCQKPIWLDSVRGAYQWAAKGKGGMSNKEISVAAFLKIIAYP